jgi:hypothetical protein
MSKLLRVIAVILIIVALVIPATTIVQADSQPDGSQIWYLDSADWGTGSYMLKLIPSASAVSTGDYTNATIMYRTDFGSETFSQGDWTVNLKLSAAVGTCVVAGIMGNSGALGIDDLKWQTVSDAGNTFTFHNVPGFTVPSNDYLGLFIQGTSENVAGAMYDPEHALYPGYTLENITVNIDHANPGSNQLQSPKTSSGAPVPELPAGALFGIGLLGICGFVYFRCKAPATGA